MERLTSIQCYCLLHCAICLHLHGLYHLYSLFGVYGSDCSEARHMDKRRSQRGDHELSVLQDAPLHVVRSSHPHSLPSDATPNPDIYHAKSRNTHCAKRARFQAKPEEFQARRRPPHGNGISSKD